MTTEDEAFIRAIVDQPGDDTPRLVYADWLDDRADPRGTYLRAETEWARPWRDGVRPELSPELTASAAGLDAVWVARVSRPPIGVCCEHVVFEQRRPSTTPEALTAVEQKHDLHLPSDYCAFLLNYNAIWSDSAFHPYRSGYFYPLLYIFAVNNSDGTPYDGPGDPFSTRWQLQQLDLSWRLQQIKSGDSWPEWDSPHLQDFIPILCDDEEPDGESGWLLLRIRGKNSGCVATFGYDPREVAPTFAMFLASLVTTDVARPQWKTRRRLFES